MVTKFGMGDDIGTPTPLHNFFLRFHKAFLPRLPRMLQCLQSDSDS